MHFLLVSISNQPKSSGLMARGWHRAGSHRFCAPPLLASRNRIDRIEQTFTQRQGSPQRSHGSDPRNRSREHVMTHITSHRRSGKLWRSIMAAIATAAMALSPGAAAMRPTPTPPHQQPPRPQTFEAHGTSRTPRPATAKRPTTAAPAAQRPNSSATTSPSSPTPPAYSATYCTSARARPAT